MKVKLLSKVGPHESGTLLEVNDKMFTYLTQNGLAEKAIEKAPENKAIFKVTKNKAIHKAAKNK